MAQIPTNTFAEMVVRLDMEHEMIIGQIEHFNLLLAENEKAKAELEPLAEWEYVPDPTPPVPVDGSVQTPTVQV